jgi:hypothetical protein
MIWKEAWLVGQAKIWSHSGIINETINCHNLTFNNMGQIRGTRGELVQWQDDPKGFSVFAGQTAATYTNRKVVHCKDYLRRLVFLGPNIFVIHDRVKLPDSSTSTPSWLKKDEPGRASNAVVSHHFARC